MKKLLCCFLFVFYGFFVLNAFAADQQSIENETYRVILRKEGSCHSPDECRIIIIVLNKNFGRKQEFVLGEKRVSEKTSLDEQSIHNEFLLEDLVNIHRMGLINHWLTITGDRPGAGGSVIAVIDIETNRPVVPPILCFSPVMSHQGDRVAFINVIPRNLFMNAAISVFDAKDIHTPPILVYPEENVKAGQVRLFKDDPNEAIYIESPILWTPDDRGLAFFSVQGAQEWKNVDLVYVDLGADAAQSKIFRKKVDLGPLVKEGVAEPDWPKFIVESIEWAADGRLQVQLAKSSKWQSETVLMELPKEKEDQTEEEMRELKIAQDLESEEQNAQTSGIEEQNTPQPVMKVKTILIGLVALIVIVIVIYALYRMKKPSSK